MGKEIRPIFRGFVCLALLVGITMPVPAQQIVSAKIGVQVISGKVIKRAKSNDRLKKGDRLRIFIEPDGNAYVYVVHTDKQKPELLTALPAGLTKEEEQIILPSVSEFYEVDGLSALEKLTILCSPHRLEEIEKLFRSENPSLTDWETIENELHERSAIDLNEETAKPFAIAGNVRDIGRQNEQFLAGLKLYSGKSLALKRYEFRVKK
jgi:hypothetical protein